MSRIRQIIFGTVRKLALLPLKLLPRRWKMSELERLASDMVTEVTTGCGSIRFWCPSSLLAMRADTMFTKEPDMIAWIDSIDQGSVFWDIGANVGVFSLYAARKTKAVVLAFEPSAANFHVLVRNIQLNHLSDQVAAYCLALSGQTELGVINLASAEPGSAMSQFGRAGETSRYWGQEAIATHGMVGITVDDFIARFQPPFPTHLKMDVDGLEWPILQGAMATLRDPRLKAVMVELSISNSDESAAAVQFLGAAGFRLESRGEEQGNAEESAANHLFVRA